MKTESKLKWLVWVVVILAILNISTLGTILYNRYFSASRTEVTGVNRMRMKKDPENFSGRYFRDKLNLDKAQMEKFREINSVFRQKAHDITLDLALIRKEMLTQLAAPHSDTIKLHLLSDSVGMLHAELKKVSFRYYLDVKNICRPDQQKKLQIIFRDVFIQDMPMRRPGPGMGPGPHGKQRGMGPSGN